jgi:hypothetical protein
MTEQMTTRRELERIDIPEPLRDQQDALTQVVRDVREGLDRGTARYRDQITKLQAERQPGAGATPELAEPTAVFGGLPYQFFDLIAVGPFQFVGSGPFRPNRIIRAGELAFLVAAVWRNPTPLGFTPGNPSAADVMAGQSFVIRGQTVNVNDVVNGPDLGPVNGTFGAGFTDFFFLLIPSVPAPPDGSPRLLDITLTIDVRSVASGLPPFAGYASQWLQLDQEPPFVFPFIPFVGGPIVVPGLVPSFVHDIPVRVMIYA